MAIKGSLGTFRAGRQDLSHGGKCAVVRRYQAGVTPGGCSVGAIAALDSQLLQPSDGHQRVED